jgi:hypothetical protein
VGRDFKEERLAGNGTGTGVGDDEVGDDCGLGHGRIEGPGFLDAESGIEFFVKGGKVDFGGGGRI